MHVDVIIPTLMKDRLALLGKCVETILAGAHKEVSVYVVIDGNAELLLPIAKMPVSIIYNNERRDWVFSINRALQYTHSPGVIYASDDLEFAPDCISLAMAKMKAVAPDLDVLVGIKQSVRGCSTAFGLMGKKFINRFPDRRVMCPDYIHYGGDSELGRFARHIGKCVFCDEAKVRHNRLRDDTFHAAKPLMGRDWDYIKRRKERNLLWGQSFELLSDGQQRIGARDR